MIHAVALKVAAGALAAGGLTVGGASAVGHCSPGQVVTGFGCGTVKETAPDETRGGTITTAVTFDVNFRDDNGDRTSSGLGANDQFHYLGAKKMGKNGDGMLIKVKQTTTGQGGWGSLYEGWIPVKYTQLPSMFN